MWFILTSDHHNMPKQEQRGSKTPKMPIFDGFCLLTRKLIFFLQVLRLFLESASPIRPLKVYFEVFPTPKQSEPGVERRALVAIQVPLILTITGCQQLVIGQESLVLYGVR